MLAETNAQRYEFFSIFVLSILNNMNIMEQKALKKQMWNAAGTAGLALGAVSAAYMFAGQMISGSLEPATGWQMALSAVLWMTKFIGCIWLMKFFMTKYAKDNGIKDNKDVFKMGAATALLSATMFSAIYLANMLYISADYYDQVYQTAFQQMSAGFDSNSMAMLEKIIDKLPQITFFYNLSYCFVFGTVLSSILSRNIPAKDPFADYKPDEQ